jgi:hypothetical protein
MNAGGAEAEDVGPSTLAGLFVRLSGREPDEPRPMGFRA